MGGSPAPLVGYSGGFVIKGKEELRPLQIVGGEVQVDALPTDGLFMGHPVRAADGMHVIVCDGRLRPEEAARIKHQWEKEFPTMKVMVVDERAKYLPGIGFLSEAPKPPSPPPNDTTTRGSLPDGWEPQCDDDGIWPLICWPFKQFAKAAGLRWPV